MQLTPDDAFQHLKESIAGYLESQYRISHPLVFQERAELLRQRGVIAQDPFIEATPAFAAARFLRELEREYPDTIPFGLSELMEHGIPMDRFPLYTHQDEALLAGFGDAGNLLIATGTGSGKTEAFVLPILARILREAYQWTAPAAPLSRGYYDGAAGEWRPSRRGETRPAGLRAFILYPMNALVNDQMSRLRRILALNGAPDWQRRRLKGNLIHFGMYTSLTQPTRGPEQSAKRELLEDYLEQIAEEWHSLTPELREKGTWPAPGGPEMLCRWDMQAAPPDILVTNYSMLEYMLIRPIESPIFQATRDWLQGADDRTLTFVLDEAHTYTGAKGTEVAHLVRRLKERLGVEPGSGKFRAIATSASIPAASGAEGELLEFVGDLFGEPAESFTLVQAGVADAAPAARDVRPRSFAAFRRFQEAFSQSEPWPAMRELAQSLELAPPDESQAPQVALHRVLADNEDLRWVRARTARNATRLPELAEECWPGADAPTEREQATAGLLAAGSYARATASDDTPPILSMRIHAFFRGVPGFWACLNPQCPEIPEAYRGDRPAGKIYTDPRLWCAPRCGSRVLELLSCRRCGLLFAGGIPDSGRGSLWPWSDDFSGETPEVKDFQIFGLERPNDDYEFYYRSTRTTLKTNGQDPYARPSYGVSPANGAGGGRLSPYPGRCPRCRNARSPGGDREIIEPLRTRGPRSISVVIADTLRVQPAAGGTDGGKGRKALVFSDSRQDAAQLAADLRTDHTYDLFRQLLYHVLHTCAECGGRGRIQQETPYRIGQPAASAASECESCQGSGYAASPSPLDYRELRRRAIDLQVAREINPTAGHLPDPFRRLSQEYGEVYREAETAFDLSTRREISQEDFGLEPLGLAIWSARLPEQTGRLEPFSEGETQSFLRIVARILATENILLPPEPARPWEWPYDDRIQSYEKRRIIPGRRQEGNNIPYNLRPYRKLGRYVAAVAKALLAEKRIDNINQWLDGLRLPLWDALKGFNILVSAGRRVNSGRLPGVPHGIRIDKFDLQPISGTVFRCQACRYIMGEALLGVCYRCGQSAGQVDADSIQNYFRRAALFARPGSGYPDPYPAQAAEHTAAISRSEARNIERWFQDLFRDTEQPEDHRVNILSVTTTMEMGIDIGSLLSVGLRNVAPTVANYQQRAGRAGRRGSSVATVVTYALNRSHDQYYFHRPKEIVSEPPRVPSLYLSNEVIARRHIRSLALSGFFPQWLTARASSGLFGAWGTTSHFADAGGRDALAQQIKANRKDLLRSAEAVVHQSLRGNLAHWLDELPEEVEQIAGATANSDLLEALMVNGLLPKYAFPVDVVKLSIPESEEQEDTYESQDYYSGISRDLRIALSEFAPGGEIIRGRYPGTYLYGIAGVYDPAATRPGYKPEERLQECRRCRAVTLSPINHATPLICPECGQDDVLDLPYLRPKGFTVDAAIPDAGRKEYRSGGRERAGFTPSAQLLVGANAVSSGSRAAFAPELYSAVHLGDLFIRNMGANPESPGFLICPDCGRLLDPDHPQRHTYPADVPPHRGYQGMGRGPRAGELCPNTRNFDNNVVLGHKFRSEVVLLALDMPGFLDAPFMEPSGRAVWHSFGTLMSEAAARVLQINPDEIQAGVRPMRDTIGRIQGEVFIYDDVPGGAGYARAIHDNLEEIANLALSLGQTCANVYCVDACYHCLLGYRNQRIHNLLDRNLGVAVLEYILQGKRPALSRQYADGATGPLNQYIQADWTVMGKSRLPDEFNTAFEIHTRSGVDRLGIQTIHPLQSKPERSILMAILEKTGISPRPYSSFDLLRRPFWVANRIFESHRRWMRQTQS